jgi:hypothetical protein
MMKLMVLPLDTVMEFTIGTYAGRLIEELIHDKPIVDVEPFNAQRFLK